MANAMHLQKRTVQARFYECGSAPSIGDVLHDWNSSPDGIATITTYSPLSEIKREGVLAGYNYLIEAEHF